MNSKKYILKLDYEIGDNNSIKSIIIKKFYSRAIDNESSVLFDMEIHYIDWNKYTKKC